MTLAVAEALSPIQPPTTTMCIFDFSGECNKMLERGRCNEHEGDLFCNACYTRKFGIKGYGYAGGNGSVLSSTSPRNSPPKRTRAPRTNGSPEGPTSPHTNGSYSPEALSSPVSNGVPKMAESPEVKPDQEAVEV